MAKIYIDFEIYIVHVKQDICDGCMKCIEMCPCDVFHFSIKAIPTNLKNCMGCRTCEASCNSNAITITEI